MFSSGYPVGNNTSLSLTHSLSHSFADQNSGTEQHRHHTCEVAVYNLFCILWEAETGEQYLMTKKNDIYSGLGKEARALNTPAEEVNKGTVMTIDLFRCLSMSAACLLA